MTSFTDKTSDKPNRKVKYSRLPKHAIVIIVINALLLLIAVPHFIICNIQYRNATAKMNDGDFQGAIAIFHDLGYYRDSTKIRDTLGAPDVIIPDGVTRITENSFVHRRILINVTIPDSLASIDSRAFSGCNKLVSVTFGEGSTLTHIGESAFAKCPSLTGFIIPSSVTHIGSNAFDSCSWLSSITIPDSVITVGSDAFKNCNRLTNIQYEGTCAQWDSIFTNQSLPVGATVTCSDGVVTIN